jgi:hypothetical protein
MMVVKAIACPKFNIKPEDGEQLNVPQIATQWQ